MATPGTRSPPRWPPAPSRHNSATRLTPRSPPPRRRRSRRTRWSARSEARTNDLEVRQAAATIGDEEGRQRANPDAESPPVLTQTAHENPGRHGLDKHRSIDPAPGVAI